MLSSRSRKSSSAEPTLKPGSLWARGSWIGSSARTCESRRSRNPISDRTSRSSAATSSGSRSCGASDPLHQLVERDPGEGGQLFRPSAGARVAKPRGRPHPSHGGEADQVQLDTSAVERRQLPQELASELLACAAGAGEREARLTVQQRYLAVLEDEQRDARLVRCLDPRLGRPVSATRMRSDVSCPSISMLCLVRSRWPNASRLVRPGVTSMSVIS